MTDERTPEPKPPSLHRVLVDDEVSKQLMLTLMQGLTPYLERAQESFVRVDRLWSFAVELGFQAPGPEGSLTSPESPIGRQWNHNKKKREQVAQDILRASVVLTHAYLEDFLRTLAAALLPLAEENRLNGIPLAGIGGRPEKFFLGKLAKHKGKTVDEVIRNSVSEYLERSTFNSTEEIAQLLQTQGIEVAEHDKEFPAIQEMMQRRHQIVHRADRVKDGDTDNYVLQPIDQSDVTRWQKVTQSLMAGLTPKAFRKLHSLEDSRPK